jgi:hypothetical protein
MLCNHIPYRRQQFSNLHECTYTAPRKFILSTSARLLLNADNLSMSKNRCHLTKLEAGDIRCFQLGRLAKEIAK